MSVKLANRETSDILMKQMYLDTLLALAKQDKRVLSVDADLRLSLGATFVDALPQQAVDCGIQEANMVGVSAGLSATGMIPFAHTFAPFVTRRVFDTTFISVAYSKLNVKLIGSDPGVTAEFNGGTHMPFEDMGMMLLVPDATVLDVCDPTMLKAVIEQIKDVYGLHYVRFPRGSARKVYEEGTKFEIGKGLVLREGKDATVIASGLLVAEALDAADMLAKENISVTVVDMFTCKPIDRELIVDCAKKTGAVITAENHNVVNGLGSMVASVLAEECPVPMQKVGVQDAFGEVGPRDYLMKRFGLTADAIVEQVKQAVKRK